MVHEQSNGCLKHGEGENDMTKSMSFKLSKAN